MPEMQTVAVVQDVVQTTPPPLPNMPDWVNWITYFVKDEPTVLVVLLLMVAIGWLVKRLTNMGHLLSRKDDTISRLTNKLVSLHRDGVPLDEATQFTIGVKPTRRKEER